MRVKRIGWAGTRTSEYPAMVAFLQGVLGLTTSQEGSDFAAFQLPEGGTFEVFGPADQDHEHFSTGPVVGFVVEDLSGAVRELEAAGVELLGGQVDERGGGWRHFRAPDGNVYELTSGWRAAVLSPGRTLTLVLDLSVCGPLSDGWYRTTTDNWGHVTCRPEPLSAAR
jgi:predicted enzyme related to lactoylglutathione lyase